MRTLTSDESGRSPTRTAQSKPSPARSTTRSLRFSEMVTSACSSRKRVTSGATWRRPKPAGAVIRKCPLAFTPPADYAGFGVAQVGQQALAVFQKRAAFVRQRDAARGAYEQFDAQPLFQRVEATPHHGGRHALGFGGCRQAAPRDH